jgi:ribonucleotide reductase beta subunit family protein with ferritin-like domain
LERGTKGGYNYSLNISKPRKIERLIYLLDDANIEYVKNEIPNTNNKICFRIKFDNDFDYKDFDWVDLTNKSKNWIFEFVDELKHWDGHIDKKTNEHFTYCSTNKKCSELVMGLCTLIGLRSHISISEDNRKESYKTSYRVYIQNTGKDTIVSKHFKVDKEFYSGMVGCITVPSGGLITKYDSKIAISGNCHARAGITILNIIFNENPKLKEKYTQEYVENLCKDYIKVEIELLDWIYSEGELGFFTKNDMINFMKYRLDGAIEKMGYSKIFNISNDDYKPMKWFDEEVYSNTLDDFFSRRPVDYTKKDKSFDVDDIFDDF